MTFQVQCHEPEIVLSLAALENVPALCRGVLGGKVLAAVNGHDEGALVKVVLRRAMERPQLAVVPVAIVGLVDVRHDVVLVDGLGLVRDVGVAPRIAGDFVDDAGHRLGHGHGRVTRQRLDGVRAGTLLVFCARCRISDWP